jgi:beta-glucosidase-like glycosyl hydrolase
MQIGRLLFPAIRWDPHTGFTQQSDAIDAALERGVGGFSIFGGEAEAVAELTASLRARSSHPILIASDLERGAGQQFRGATPLPPLAAIGSLDDIDTTRRAASLTAREALALGVNWIYAPVADVDLEPRNPIIGSRAFGTSPDMVARHVTAWIRGCHDEGAICCAKHFPGHGRTIDDSHATLPRVDVSRDELDEADLKPFFAATRAGVDSVMTAHVSFPALDQSGTAATLSQPIVGTLLRRELGFSGLVVTDALIMEGVLEAGAGEAGAAVAAVAAGCDALLYPRDLEGVAKALEGAIGRTLSEIRVADAIERVNAIAARTPTQRDTAYGTEADREWAIEVGARSIVPIRGEPQLPRSFDLLTVDDDLGGPFPAPARDRFVRALGDAGFDVHEVDRVNGRRGLVVALYCDIRAWKGRPGLSESARSRIEDVVADRPNALIVFFGHPRLASDVPGETVLAAWGGEGIMQEAAARWLENAA